MVLCILPTILLGVTYFFLVEYVLREHGLGSGVAPLLRYGGGGLLLLFSLAALACGVQISDAISRPLRALLRVVEGAGVPPGQEAYLPGSDPELRLLFLRVHTLVQQNRSGAQTLSELESLKREVDGLSNDFRQANERMEVPPLLLQEGVGPEGKLTQEMERFWGRLRIDLDGIEEKLAGVVQTLAEQETAWAASYGETEGALREIERLGTVWSLEVEIARRGAQHLPGELGSCFREFTAAIERLREATRSKGDAAGAVAKLRSEIARLRDTVGTWLPRTPGDEQETESSDR